MRFSMNDVTRDGAGRVVEGDATLRTMGTEIWTFVRAGRPVAAFRDPADPLTSVRTGVA